MAGAVKLSIDGAPATLDDLVHVALVNYGAYTSFQVEQGGVRGLDLHLARLEAEALELFGEAVDEARLRELMRAALGDLDNGWLRVSLFSPEISPRTPGWVGRPKVMVGVFPSPSPLGATVRLQPRAYQREAPHLKHVATFGLIRSRRLARVNGFDDALFIDGSGQISEGSLWNIGFLTREEVVWPKAPMLAGVAQALVGRGLGEAGLTGRTAPVRLGDLPDFDAAFICNSATPACAVTAIGDHAFAAQPGMIERLAAAWASNPSQPI